MLTCDRGGILDEEQEQLKVKVKRAEEVEAVKRGNRNIKKDLS